MKLSVKRRVQVLQVLQLLAIFIVLVFNVATGFPLHSPDVWAINALCVLTVAYIESIIYEIEIQEGYQQHGTVALGV